MPTKPMLGANIEPADDEEDGDEEGIPAILPTSTYTSRLLNVLIKGRITRSIEVLTKPRVRSDAKVRVRAVLRDPTTSYRRRLSYTAPINP